MTDQVLGVRVWLTLLVWIVVTPAGVIAQSASDEPPDENVADTRVQSQGPVEPNEVPVVAEPTPAQPVGHFGASELIDPERLSHHLPDPEDARREALEKAAQATRTAGRTYNESLARRIDEIIRPRQLVLSLQDALHRAIVNSFTVRVASYNPAIETTRVVEAEAAFDAAFFLSVTKNKQNQPTASALIGSNIDTFDITGGIRKVLPTGMLATASLNARRFSNDFAFQELNPQWTSAFVVELQQPFLRGFGIDFNRSVIRLAKLDQRISEHAFQRQVIDLLANTERAYWDLVRARRQVVISGRLLSSFEQTYDYLYQRREFDAYKIQIADTEARLERTKAGFIQIVANVRNAEDRLISLMNDPTIDLADDVEIIPVDFPSQAPVVLDRLSEIQAALDHRPELHEARLRVKQAKIGVGQANNQALPRLDTVFRYTVDGLGPSAHDAFSEVSKNDFHEYYIGVEFEWPIGNRGPRAAARRARLQHAQAIAALEQRFENALYDVNVRVREVQTNYDQISPGFASVEANEDQYEALVARAEAKNYLQLNQELNALQSLAASRQEFLKLLVDYTLALIELERAKGTLPEYNNIVIVGAESE